MILEVGRVQHSSLFGLPKKSMTQMSAQDCELLNLHKTHDTPYF